MRNKSIMQYYNSMKAYQVVNNFTSMRRDEALGPQYIGVADCRPTNCSTYTFKASYYYLYCFKFTTVWARINVDHTLESECELLRLRQSF